MKWRKPLSLFVTAVVLSSLVPSTDALAVMAIDLGTEFLKIAIVKPGVPMEIVLNRESQRKSPVAVAMRDGERLFSDAALQTAVKFPRKAFWYLTHLVGKKFEDPDVAIYQKRFPYYNLVKDEKTGTVRFKVQDETEYSPEELLGMILEIARDDAETFAEQPIKDAVITVPPFFTQAERRAIKRAAEMVGITVLQLMSDNAAVALNYGIFRRKEFNSSMQYYIFYDMGSTSTTATVVGYQMVKTKEGTIMETNPQVAVKGVGFDKTLGGLEMALRIQQHLGKLFNGQKKTKTDVFTNERAMGKLFKEANRVKKILSANSETYAQVENLLEEQDFKAKLTRADFEEMCSDLFERVTKPVEDALKASEITMGEVTEVILMGGGSRVPKVQEKLVEFSGGRELGKSINTDEAAALGAVYQAAHLSKGFRVKKFIVKEGNIYPIVVQFERKTTSDSGETSTKVVNRTLFGYMNPFPQKKVMTFNKHHKDFHFHVRYGSADMLSAENQRSLGNGDILKVKLIGVEDSFDKHAKVAESKGIKAHFRLDESGLLVLDTVESVFEKQPDPEDVENKDESAWSKLGSAIGGLFGGAEKDGGGEGKPEEGAEEGSPPATGESAPTNTTDTSSTPKDEAKPDTKTKEEEPQAEEPKAEEESTPEDKTSEDTPKEDPPKEEKEDGKDEKEEAKQSEKSDDKKADKDSDKKDGDKKDGEKKDDDKKDSSKKNETEEEKPKKPKIVIIKEEIKAKTKLLDQVEPSEDSIKESKTKLQELRKKDKEKHLLLKAKNELEAFIFETQDKLSLDEFMQCSQEKEREEWMSKLSAAGDWQYEQPDDAGKEVFIEKLKELKAELKDLFVRVKEARDRPGAVAELRNALKQGLNFSESILNLTKADPDIFTQVEMDTLKKVLNETEEWLNTTVKQQEETPLYEPPVLTKAAIVEKGVAVAREVQYLITKMVSYKQRPKTKTKDDKNSTDKASSNDTTADKDEKTIETPDSSTTETPEEGEIPPPPTQEGTEGDNSKQSEDIPVNIVTETSEESSSKDESSTGETTSEDTKDTSEKIDDNLNTEKDIPRDNNHDAGEL